MQTRIIGTEKRRAEEVLEQAKEFIDEYYASIRR